MFTSINNSNSNSNNKHNSYHYYYTSTDQQHSMLDRSFTNDVSPNIKHDQHHHHTHLPSYFPFSSSYTASSNEDDVQLFQQHQHLMNMSHLNQRTLAVPGAKTNKVVDVNAPIDPSFANDHNQRNGQADQIPHKRSSKKDRHSKIITAQGPRDRRMRLSLPVARKFFPLQDILGFDKASKTVEWLMKHADSEIRKLNKGVSQAKPSCSRSDKSVSSTSECEVVSGIDEINNSEDIHQESILDGKAPASNAKESKKVRRKLVFNPHAKESRAMARARARKRTVEKKWSRSQHQCLQGLKHLTSSSSYEKGEESNSHCHDLKYSSDQVIDMENISHQGPMNDIVEEDSFSITNKANQSSIFGYNHEITISQGVSSCNFDFPNYLGNWETNLARTSSSHSMINKNQSSGNAEEQIPSLFPLTPMDSTFPFQFADIHFCRPCEPYNSHGLS